MTPQSSAMTTESENSPSTERCAMPAITPIHPSASLTPPPKRKPQPNLTCFHCPEKIQGIDENGRPEIKCLKLGGKANPFACGQHYMGCEE